MHTREASMDAQLYRVPPDFDWPNVGRPGMVPVGSLMGDPNQPRKYFDEKDLDALAATMDPKKKGIQREIITVRRATEAEMKENPGVRYVIKSGERRWRAAKRAGLDMVEIRVKEYASYAEEKLDMYMLNEGRVGLTDIENARYLEGLMDDFNLETQEELADLVGKHSTQISALLSLLKLVPEAQALMEPWVPERSRLGLGSAVLLSRLSQEAQQDLVSRMPKGEGISNRRQAEWIKTEIQRTGIESRSRRMKPATIRRRVAYFGEMVNSRAKEILGFEEFDRILDNTTPAQRYALRQVVQTAHDNLGRILQAVGGSVDLAGATQAMHTTPSPASQKPAASQPDIKKQAASFAAHRSQQQKVPPTEPQAPQGRTVRVVAPSPRTASAPQARVQPPKKAYVFKQTKRTVERAVNYYDDSVNRIVTNNVDCARYRKLWDQGLLEFQVKNKPKPEHLPERDEEW